MGDGSKNTSTTPGMLPATSATEPYVITTTQIYLASDYRGFDSGPVWKVFDQNPGYGQRWCTSGCYYGNHPEYLPEEFVLGYHDPPNPSARIMVDLGEGNAKCFDKFAFSQSEYEVEYFAIRAFCIQGSNQVGVTVEDSLTSSAWDMLLAWWDESYWVGYDNWSDFFTFTNYNKYRYYRVSVLNASHPNELRDDAGAAFQELIFVEEQSLVGATKLLLHMNGDDESDDFIDSSYENHTVTTSGSVVQDADKYKFGGTAGRFNAPFDYLIIPDDNNWNLFSAPFTIDFWIYLENPGSSEKIFEQYQDEDNYVRCIYYHTLGKIEFVVFEQQTEKIVIEANVSIPLNEWTHIAIVGSSE